MPRTAPTGPREAWQTQSAMSQPLVYVDRSTVREGALLELRDKISELAAFVEENEPQLISYSVYFSEDGTEMTVVHVHVDADSLDYHMDVAGPRFAPFAHLVRLSSIHVYGEPSDHALARLREKLHMLGSGEVIVDLPHAGFSRPLQAAPEPPPRRAPPK